MARKTFGELFAEGRGGPIRFHGTEVHAIHEVPVALPTELALHFMSANPAARQALRIAVDGGHAVVNGQQLREVVLWADTAPPSVRIEVVPTGGRAVVKMWNAWEDNTGAMQAWLGDCGMVIEATRTGVTLRCSDGLGPPDFSDLVVRVDRG
jgi:hypothetical protein